MFQTLFYNPIYNILVSFINFIPNHDAGIAVVLVTMLVSILLYKVSGKAIKTQMALKTIEPELEKIKNEVKDKEVQAREILALYRKNKVNPLSMILLMLIQLPILFALYYVFWKGLPVIDVTKLYSFVALPPNVNMMFLGIVDIGKRSIVLAIISGVTQFFQAFLVAKRTPRKEKIKGAKRTVQEEFSDSMQLQMKYFFPVIIVFIGVSLPSALPLYWSVRNIFTIVQELLIAKNQKA